MLKLIGIAGVVMMVACDGGGGGIGPDGDVVGSGTVAPAASGNAFVFWVADDGGGDYAYKYGEGVAAGSTFEVAFDEPLPAAATFGGSVGIGQVVVVSTALPPDGVIDDAAFQTGFVGYGGRYAFIFRSGTDDLGVEWLSAFPVGISCGKCVDSGAGFDTFEPIACDAMEVQTGTVDEVESCNWT